MIKRGVVRMFSVGFAVGKATVFCVGLAVLLGLGFALAGSALAADPGDPFRLGKSNEIDALTRLVGTRATPLLQVKNDGGPALNLVAPAGKAPFLVSAGAGLVTNLDADRLDGRDSGAFMPGTLVQVQNPQPSEGTALADGTRFIDVSCPAGSRLLSGGPANIDAGTIVLESFPGAPSTNSWRTRIQNDGSLDAFSTVVLCARF